MGTEEMLELQIIKVEDPGCLLGRVLKGCGVPPDCDEEYQTLRVNMNMFYHNVNLDVPKVTPTKLNEGQMCVVFSEALKSWCRALVESVLEGNDDTHVRCFLVDYGEHVIIRACKVRTPLARFLLLPFRVQRFRLAGICPMTVQVSVLGEQASMVSASKWDFSAVKYLHSLLEVSSLVEAVLCDEKRDECYSIELYLTINDAKICVNHELVFKKFACFAGDSHAGDGQSPLCLAWDIYSSPQELLEMNGLCLVQAPALDFHRMKENIQETKPPEPEETHAPAEKNGEASLSWRSVGPLTIGRGWRVRTEAVDFSVDEEHGSTQTDSQYLDSKNLGLLSLLNSTNRASFVEDESCSSGSDGTGGGFVSASATGVSDSSEEQEASSLYQEPTRVDQAISSRLLQFLNPDPINPDPEQEAPEVKVERADPGRSGVLVHSALPIKPCGSLADAPISENSRKFLLRMKYGGPYKAESYFWPAVARGVDTVLVSHGGNNPLSYLPPLLAQMKMASLVSQRLAHTGPSVVILCPSWEKVQTVMELLDGCREKDLNPASVLLGLDQEEPQRKIQRNCQLLVTTAFSMIRLLAAQSFLFLDLCHLVLDEADVLHSQAAEQVTSILKTFKQMQSGKDPLQIIAVSCRWTEELESLVQDHMTWPSIIITVMEEAATYGRVHQRVQLCQHSEKISILLESLDLHPPQPQKTLVITNSAEEVEHVYQVVINTAAFTLKAHEGLTHQFETVVGEWNKHIGPATQVILVVTHDCLKALGLRDATCIVHYGFPGSPKQFGRRLFCMADNFRNILQERGENPATPQSLMLLSERNGRHVCGVMRHLRRGGATLPPELLEFASGVLQAREELKRHRPLCPALKSFGFCRDSSVCPDRHVFNQCVDQMLSSDTGSVLILPLHIKTANVYFGRVVKPKDDDYETLASDMKAHYEMERRCASQVMEGELYAIQEENHFKRVRITKAAEKKTNQIFSSAAGHFIDEGHTQEVKCHQLLQLPPEFQKLPGQAVEIIVCRAQPIDGESHWNPKVTRAIAQKIKGKLHHAKVVMRVGGAIWVDPMVYMTRTVGLKTYIAEYSIHAEILASGFGINNPNHLDMLKKAHNDAGDAQERELDPQSASPDLKEGHTLWTGGQPITGLNSSGDTKGDAETLCRTGTVFTFRPVSFHPQIKWFQKSNCVTVRVKLINPLMQKCEFHLDRVHYSGYVNDRHYTADLELCGEIIPEDSSWHMSCNEPVMKLMKRERQAWKSLLKIKSAFVSYDFERYDSERCDEMPDFSPNGVFVAQTGEDGDYLNTESDSSSDSD